MAATSDERRGSRWNLLVWGGAAALLAIPAVAMQFSSEVKWGPIDFATVGAMLLIACGAYELATRMSRSLVYRAGVGVAVVAAFLLIFINIAVGIIGDEGDPANLMFAGVLLVAIAGAAIARFRAAGMARAMAAAALAQALAGAIALVGGWGVSGPAWPWDVVGLSIGFTVMWLTAAWLFAAAARAQNPAQATL